MIYVIAIIHFITAKRLILSAVSWFLYTCVVNALPPDDQAFIFGKWFRKFLKEVKQDAPASFPILTDEQKTVLAKAGMPVKQ